MKSLGLPVIFCLGIYLSASLLYGSEQYLVITEEGQYVREIDVTGWQPGEDFVYFFADEGSYQPYLWQGEDSLDYQITYDSLWVFGKLVGLNIGWMESGEIENRGQIQYLSVPPDRLSVLKDFPNVVAVEIGSPQEDELELDLRPLYSVKNLRALFLLKSEVTDETMNVISGLSELRVLDLKIAYVPESGWSTPLVKLSHLHTLILPHFPVEENALALSGLQSLESLTSYYTVVDTEFVELFKTLPRLKKLTVIQAEIADPVLAYFAQANHLEELNLPHAGVYGDKISYIGQMTNLKALDLCGTEVEDSQVVHLSNLTNLRRLDLRTVYLTDEGLKHLSSLENLRELILCSEEITDEGLKCLESLENLHRLDLCSCGITDEGLKHLRTLSSLRYVDVTDTKVSEQGISELAKTLPDCRIVKRY